MKSIFTVMFLIITCSFLSAQPLNGSFENWNTIDPVDWYSSDEAGSGAFNGVIQSSDAHEGSSSCRLEVIDIGGGFGLPPFIWSTDDSGNWHPVSQKHGSLKGWYKFSPLGNDVLYVLVVMMDSDSTAVGAGGWTTANQVTSWTEFDVPITYTPGSPDPVQTAIYIGISDTSGGVMDIGSFAIIDHLSFTAPSSVEQISSLPNDFTLKQNYPNPFNPSTKIEYSIPEASFVQLKVYDILGNEVVTLVNEEQSAGTYRADFTGQNLASGLYIAELIAGNFKKTIKMTLLR